MELRQLKTFRTVATTMSFHRAAEVLHYAQSTVSAQIRALEEDFNVPLFDRLGKKISLTDAGQKLMHYAERLLDIEKETLSQMADSGIAQGKLSIRMPQTLSSYFLPEILKAFKPFFPHIGLNVETCSYHSLQQELKTGVTDLAFLFAEDPYAPEILSEVLGGVEIVMVLSSKHPLASKKRVKKKDLYNETILLPKHDCAYKMQLEQTLAEEKIGAIVMEFNNTESIKQCVLENIGIGLIPEMMVRSEIANGALVVLPGFCEKTSVDILMLRHRDKWLSPCLKSFMQHSREVIKRLG